MERRCTDDPLATFKTLRRLQSANNTFSCNPNSYDCGYSTWDNWGRWVALVVIVIAIILLALAFSYISSPFDYKQF